MNTDVLAAVAGAAWGVAVVDAASGEVFAEHKPHACLATASVGKLLLLVELAERIARGDVDPAERLDRRAVDPVADSGLWQHLATDVLPVVDAAVLVGSVSDNLATNVLLRRLGLESVQRWPARLGLAATMLHDRVRDSRGPEHPGQLSSGTAADLARLMRLLATDRVGVRGVGPQVLGWLAGGVDVSLVAAALGVDPLAHGDVDRGLHVVNKTGTDDGLRADVGLVAGAARTVAYAVIVNWSPGSSADPRRDAVLHGMRHIGEQIRACVSG